MVIGHTNTLYKYLYFNLFGSYWEPYDELQSLSFVLDILKASKHKEGYLIQMHKKRIDFKFFVLYYLFINVSLSFINTYVTYLFSNERPQTGRKLHMTWTNWNTKLRISINAVSWLKIISHQDDFVNPFDPINFSTVRLWGISSDVRFENL